MKQVRVYARPMKKFGSCTKEAFLDAEAKNSAVKVEFHRNISGNDKVPVYELDSVHYINVGDLKKV